MGDARGRPTSAQGDMRNHAWGGTPPWGSQQGTARKATLRGSPDPPNITLAAAPTVAGTQDSGNTAQYSWMYTVKQGLRHRPLRVYYQQGASWSNSATILPFR